MTGSKTFNPGRAKKGQSEPSLRSPRARTPQEKRADTAPRVERFCQSVTDRQTFRNCRRQWHLGTIQRLAPAGQVPWHFIFGDVVHESLAVYYKNRRSVKKCLETFNVEWEKADQYLRKLYGNVYNLGVGEEWLSYKAKGTDMLIYYDRFDKSTLTLPNNIFKWEKILGVNIEERGFVTVLDLEGNPMIEKSTGLPYLLSGKIDLAVKRKDGTWIIDHKTASQKPNLSALDIDDQLTGYCYVWWRMTGEVPRGVIYNVLVKDPPHPPRILQPDPKTGEPKVSRDKAQRTTYDLYLRTLKELKLDPKDYEEHLNFLAEKGWYQFFIRDGSTRTLEELQNFERRLYYEFLDMEAALEEEGKRYPNPSQWNCGGCPVIAICKAMEEGSDPGYLIEHGFQILDPRYVVPEGV